LEIILSRGASWSHSMAGIGSPSFSADTTESWSQQNSGAKAWEIHGKVWKGRSIRGEHRGTLEHPLKNHRNWDGDLNSKTSPVSNHALAPTPLRLLRRCSWSWNGGPPTSATFSHPDVFFRGLTMSYMFFRGIGISRFRSCSIPCDYVHLDFICFNFLKIGCFPFDVICYSQPDTCSTVHALPSKASGTHWRAEPRVQPSERQTRKASQLFGESANDILKLWLEINQGLRTTGLSFCLCLSLLCVHDFTAFQEQFLQQRHGKNNGPPERHAFRYSILSLLLFAQALWECCGHRQSRSLSKQPQRAKDEGKLISTR
jgi:hypothetical protein